jgi:hypothetical protein
MNTTEPNLVSFIFYHELEPFPFSNAKHGIDIKAEKNHSLSVKVGKWLQASQILSSCCCYTAATNQ